MRILVEDAANGTAVIDALKHEIAGTIAVTPEGGKYSPAAAAEPIVAARLSELGDNWITGVRPNVA